jgi:gas vesicle protein
MSERGGGRFTAGLVIGALLGASVAVLITPESDVRTERFRRLYSRGREIIDAARSDLGAALDEGKTAADEHRKRLEHLET